MPADDASILRAAEADRDHAERLSKEHRRNCKVRGCPDCRSLRLHALRTQYQVALLTPADGGKNEAMF